MAQPKRRTTIAIDESVFKDAKQNAARDAVTLSQYIEEALRLRHATQNKPRKPFKLHSVPGGQLQPGVDLTNNAALQEILDEGIPIEKLR